MISFQISSVLRLLHDFSWDCLLLLLLSFCCAISFTGSSWTKCNWKKILENIFGKAIIHLYAERLLRTMKLFTLKNLPKFKNSYYLEYSNRTFTVLKRSASVLVLKMSCGIQFGQFPPAIPLRNSAGTTEHAVPCARSGPAAGPVRARRRRSHLRGGTRRSVRGAAAPSAGGLCKCNGAAGPRLCAPAPLVSKRAEFRGPREAGLR